MSRRSAEFVEAAKEFKRLQVLEAIASELKQQPKVLKDVPQLAALLQELDAA